MSKVPSFVIKDPVHVGRIIEMDQGFKCIDCTVEERTKSRLQIQELCQWWLSDVATKCNIETSIHAGSTEKYPNTNAGITFYATFPGDVGKLAVMLVMVQHEAVKPGQHYQFQLPHGSLMRRGDPEFATMMDSITDDCRAQTKCYSVEEKSEKLKMIRMRSYGLEKVRAEIQNAILSMVSRIQAIETVAT